MPTILRVGGFQIRVYLPPREHGPPHMHVLKAGKEILVNLSPVGLREDFGMAARDIIGALRIVEANERLLLLEWRKHHGEATE